MSSDAFSSSIRPGSSSLYARGHSIYGIEDRIVLDIGSLYIKCGFSGEPRPRHIVPTWSRQRRSQAAEGEAYCIASEFSELYELDMSTRSGASYIAFEQRLARLLHDVYYRLLLADPKSSKVIVLESPLTPVCIKQTIAKVLFQKLHVPSVSFTPAHLLALLTIGQTTGLVVDCGHLEMTVLPSLLTPNVIEDIKTRICIVSPVPVSGDSSSDPVDLWRDFSAATDLYHPMSTTAEGKSWLFVPGWVRERAAEVLFENDNDDDQKSVVETILDSLCKVQPDIRKPLISNVLLIGGTAMLPGFRTRLHQEMLRVMRTPTDHEKRHYSSVLRLHQFLKLADENGGDVFKSNVRAWIGGSLAGTLKTSGPEVLKERWNGVVPDWSAGISNVSNATADVQH
ncbi:hypothetical protein Unana1_01311 [Umbelopsis nana]